MPSPSPGGRCVLLAEEVWGTTLHAMRSVAAVGGQALVVTAGEGAEIYRRSRSCAGALDVAVDDPVAFCGEVRRWVDAQWPGDDPVAVIPLSDRLVEWLLLGGDELSDRFHLGVPPQAVAEELLDKARQFRVAERADVAPPPWVEVRTDADVEAIAGLRAPLAIRPTGWDAAGEDYFKLIVAPDRTSAEATVRDCLARGAALIVQEFVDAPADAVEFAMVWRSRTSDRLDVCTGRKRAQSGADGGVMAWGEAVDLPDVADAARRFVETSGFVGLGGIEVIRSGGTLWFIEFNPRLEAIHFLATQAGVDTVACEFLELIGRPVPPPAAQRPAAAWVGSAWLQRLTTDRSAWRQVARDRVAFARARNGVRAVWSWRDPAPGLAVTARIAQRGLRSRTGGSR